MKVTLRDPKQYRYSLKSWIADPFSLDEKWTERARIEVNEDPTTVRSNVEALRRKVLEEEDLHGRTDDLFLLAFLRARKHNIEEAFKVLKNYYRIRFNYPEFFELCLPSDYEDLYDLNWINVLEDKDQLERPVVYIKSDFDSSKISRKQIVQLMSHTLDMLIMDPHVQISGITYVSNLAGVSLSHMRILSPTFVYILSRIFNDTFPVRLRCSVSFNVAYLFKKVWAIIRPMLKEKLRNRTLLIGGDDLGPLHEAVTPDILPPDARGKKPYCPEILKERIGAIEPAFKDWSKYGYTEEESGE